MTIAVTRLGAACLFSLLCLGAASESAAGPVGLAAPVVEASAPLARAHYCRPHRARRSPYARSYYSRPYYYGEESDRIYASARPRAVYRAYAQPRSYDYYYYPSYGYSYDYPGSYAYPSDYRAPSYGYDGAGVSVGVGFGGY